MPLFNSTFYSSMLEVHICLTNPKKKLAALIHPIIFLQFSLVFYLKSLKLSSTLTSLIIRSLILFFIFIIISMTSKDQGQLLMSFMSLILIYSLLPLGNIVGLVWWHLKISKAVDFVWHTSLSKLPSFAFPFAYSCLVFYQIISYLHMLMERPHPPFLLIVVFLRVSLLSLTLFLFFINNLSYTSLFILC